jgi:hypothetical protein
MHTRRLPRDHSVVFARVVATLRAAVTRPEVRLTEVPAPQRIAPYAWAVTADVVDTSGGSETDLATGRFVLLYDPAEPEPWSGPWRIVTFARAELEPELATDPCLSEVGWSWLIDSLAAQDAPFLAEAGTVTRVVSESFAGLSDREPSVEMEIRASWTPADDDPTPHLAAWLTLVCTIAGLPPLPDGVVALPGQRR